MSTSAFNDTIPTFISSPTAEGLRALMLEMNTSNNTNYDYFDIYSKGKLHYAWYWIRQSDLVKALVNEQAEREAKNG